MVTNYNKKKISMVFVQPLFGKFFYAFFLGMFFFSFSAHAATAKPWDSAQKDSINVDTVMQKAGEKATQDQELKKKLLEKLQTHFQRAQTTVSPATGVSGAPGSGSTLKILRNKEASIKKLEEKVTEALASVEKKQLSDNYKAIVDLSAQEAAKKTMESWSEKFKTAFTSHPALIIGGLIVGAFAGYEIYKTAMMGTGIFSRIGSAGKKIWSEAGESIDENALSQEIAGKIKIGDDATVTVEDLKPSLKTLTDSLLSEVAQDVAVQEATGGLEAASKALKIAAKEIDPTEGAGKFTTSTVLPLTDTDFNRNIADKNADFENIQNVLIKEFKTDEDLKKAAASAKILKDALTDEGKVKLKNNLELISQEIDGEIKALKGIRLPEVDVEYEVTTIRANGGGTFRVGKDNLQEWIKVGKTDENLQGSILTYKDPEEKSVMPGYKATRLVVNKEGVVTAKQIIKASGEKEVAEDVPVEKGSELLFERKVAKANDAATSSLTGDGNKAKKNQLDDLITPHVVAKALYGDSAEPAEGDAALIKNPAKTVEQLGEELQLATSPVALAQKFGSQDELAAEEIDRVQKKIKSIDEKYLENKKMLADQETEIAKKAGGVSEVGTEGTAVKKKKWEVYSDEHKALIQKLTDSSTLTDDQIKKKLTKYDEDKAFHNKPIQVSDVKIFNDLSDDQKNEIKAVSAAIKKLYPSIDEEKIKVNYHPTGGLVVYAELEKSKCPVGNGKTIFVTLNNASFDVREPGTIKNRFCWDWKPDNVKVSSETLLKFGSQEGSQLTSKEDFETIAKKSPFNYFVDDRDYNLGDLSSYNDSWMDEFLKTDHLVSFKAIRDSIDDTKVKNLFKDTSANPSDDEINTAKDFIAGQLSLEINGFGNRVGKIEGFSKEDGALRLKTSKESNVISESGEDYRKNYFSKNFLKDGASGESLKQQSIKSVIDNAFKNQKVHVKVGDKLIAFDNIQDQALREKVKNIVTRQLDHDLKNSRLAIIRETGSFVISRAAEPPSKLKVTRSSDGAPQGEVIPPTREEREDMSGELKVEYAPAMPQKNLFSALLDESATLKMNLKGFVNDLSDLQPQEFLDTAVKNAASTISSWFKPFSVMSDDAFRASMYEAAKTTAE